MPRYSAIPAALAIQEKQYFDDQYPDQLNVPAIQVHENQPVRTGIVDARGNHIMRMPLPIGFGRMEEW